MIRNISRDPDLIIYVNETAMEFNICNYHVEKDEDYPVFKQNTYYTSEDVCG